MIVDCGGDEVYGESIYINWVEIFGNYELFIWFLVFFQVFYNFYDQDSYYGDVVYLVRQEIVFV